ncbi:MAG: hypothetical protein FWF77_05510 [Defluviitaleaceae bacterium]|nr:hypothetical protein [Defluviitaleaceae bacterium]
MDTFKEQLVKRNKTAKDTAIKICLVILVILLALPALYFLQAFGVLAIFALAFGAHFVMGFFNIEYEYIFTNGELDIDIIYNKSRRKRALTVDMKQVEVFAHIDDASHAHAMNSAQETRDFSSGTHGPDTYTFLTTHESKKIKVILDPNEKMLKAFSTAISRRKFHLRPGSGVVLVG